MDRLNSPPQAASGQQKNNRFERQWTDIIAAATPKLSLQLFAAEGCLDLLQQQLVDFAKSQHFSLQNPDSGITAYVFSSLPAEQDPFRSHRNKVPVAVCDLTLEIAADNSRSAPDWSSVCASLAGEIDGLVVKDSNIVLIGDKYDFYPEKTAGSLCLQYLMRRRQDWQRAAYLQYYIEDHSRFGMRSRGITGYQQFYVDCGLSQQVAQAAGFGQWNYDTVSELYIDEMAAFLAGIEEDPKIVAEAAADEELFVDRQRSTMFISRHIELD